MENENTDAELRDNRAQDQGYPKDRPLAEMNDAQYVAH